MKRGTPMNNKVGMCYMYWCRDWSGDFIPYAKRAAKIGYDILEISLRGVDSYTKDQLMDLKKAGDDLGISYTAGIDLTPDRDMSSPDPKIRQNAIEYIKRMIEMTYYLGSPVISGVNMFPWLAKGPLGLTDKTPYIERGVECMKQIMPVAEDYGIDYAFEIVNRFEQFILNTAEEGAAFCRLVGSPRMKMHLDTFHMNIEEDSMTSPILDYPQYVGYFHVGEANRKAPFGGRLPWDDMFAALGKIGYTGPIVLEPFIKMGGQVGYDATVWRDLSGNANEEGMDRIAADSLKFIRGLLKKY